jgi:hypothetical protein
MMGENFVNLCASIGAIKSVSIVWVGAEEVQRPTGLSAEVGGCDVRLDGANDKLACAQITKLVVVVVVVAEIPYDATCFMTHHHICHVVRHGSNYRFTSTRHTKLLLVGIVVGGEIHHSSTGFFTYNCL